jgi:hypothetical protein
MHWVKYASTIAEAPSLSAESDINGGEHGLRTHFARRRKLPMPLARPTQHTATAAILVTMKRLRHQICWRHIQHWVLQVLLSCQRAEPQRRQQQHSLHAGLHCCYSQIPLARQRRHHNQALHARWTLFPQWNPTWQQQVP